MRYLGVIGNPIAHSLSPVMHNQALKAQGLDFTYLPFQVEADALAKALLGFEALHVVGVNVTIPHKVEIIAHLDQISKEAELIGAVNTIHYQNGKWIGYNTDGVGFLRSLQEDGGIDPKGALILLLGAGGAARAVAVQLGLAGAREIIIANRTRSKAEALADELSEKILETRYRAVGFTELEILEEMRTAKILINATPIGMISYEGNSFPIRREWIRQEQVVADLVYRPMNTPLLEMAVEAGATTLTGDGMLLYQGVEAYRIWTGLEPPVELMRKALVEKLIGENNNV